MKKIMTTGLHVALIPFLQDASQTGGFAMRTPAQTYCRGEARLAVTLGKTKGYQREKALPFY